MVMAKAGSRWRSATCSAEVVVVKAPPGEIDLRCGGEPMVPHGAGAVDAAADGEHRTLVGKRYLDVDETTELLCTKGGCGELTIDGVALTPKGAKPLPSSD
jgi:hypothetical protein